MYKKNLLVAGCFLLASGAIYSSAAVVGDINGDGKIDLTESIFALQVASGAYPGANTSCQLAGKGDWASSTSYNECDVVKNGDSHFICTATHTSAASFVTDSAKWTKLVLAANWEKNGDKIHYNAGNVGVGTTNPAAKLDISGNLTGYSTKIVNTKDTDSGHGLYIETRSNATGNYVARFLSNAGSTDVMAIKGDGAVGVGTTSPSSGLKLDVAGKVGASEYCDENGNNCSAITTLVAGSWAEASGNISRSGGNVGIGTSSPTVSLQIYGREAPFGTTNYHAALALEDDIDKPAIAFGGTSGLGALIEENSGTLSFYTGTRGTGSWSGHNNFFIEADGDIGIGTTTPSSGLKLDVEGKIGANEYCDESGANCSSATELKETVALWTHSPSSANIKHSEGNVSIGTLTGSGEEKLTVSSWENHAEPLASFVSWFHDVSIEIRGDGGESYLEILNDDTTENFAWKIGLNDANRLDFKYGTAHNMNTGSGLPTIMSMTTAGKVGIGTENPKSKFAVSGLPSGTTSAVVTGDSSGLAGAVCITVNGSMYIDTDGSCAD